MGSSICLEEFSFIIRERKLDIVLLQEPYSIGEKVPHVDNYRAYYSGKNLSLQ